MVDGIFDSHAHYDDDAFDADRDGLLRSLASHGVRRVMNVGSSMESSRTGIQLGKEYDFLYSSVGVHPDSAREICDETLRELAELAREKGCPVLGEFGCQGYDTFGPFKLVGGIAKGHPNERDLENARSFYRGLLESWDGGAQGSH